MLPVASVLQELHVPEDKIQDVMKMLDEYADELHTGNVKPVQASVFGGSATGGELGYHADTARQHVAKSVLDMVAGLRGYRDNLSSFAADVVTQDEEAGSRLTAQLPKIEACTSAADYTVPSACTLPGSGEGDD